MGNNSRTRHKIFIPTNDDLMSYFTRIYDGYFYIFCAIFTLVEIW